MDRVKDKGRTHMPRVTLEKQLKEKQKKWDELVSNIHQIHRLSMIDGKNTKNQIKVLAEKSLKIINSDVGE